MGKSREEILNEIENEIRAHERRANFSLAGTPYEAYEWLTCGDLAEKAELLEKAKWYRRKAIGIYEKKDDINRARELSERFGMTALTEYFEKLIKLKSEHP